MLPNFLIIGAQKAGTTSISLLLSEHPDVFMPAARETRFFVEDSVFEMGLANYEIRSFGGWSGEKVLGEKTPEYLLFDETPARALGVLGDRLKIIVCLRSPASRAISHYRHNLQQMVEDMPFADALRQEDARISGSRARTAFFGYKYRGSYTRRLKPWLSTFDAANFLFLDFAQIVSDAGSQALRHRVFDFLEIDCPAAAPLPHAGAATPPSWRMQGDVLTVTDAKGRAQSVRSPSPHLTDFAMRAGEAAKSIPTSSEAIGLNREWWHADIAKLRRWTGSDWSHWLD